MRAYRYQYQYCTSIATGPVAVLCTCATTRAAMVVSKSKDSAPFSRPTVPHSQQYHLIVGPLGPVQSYASWASTTALGIFDGIRGFFRCAEFLSAGQKQFVAPADGSCSLLGPQFCCCFSVALEPTQAVKTLLSRDHCPGAACVLRVHRKSNSSDLSMVLYIWFEWF